MDLCGGEFVGIAALNLGDDGVAGFDALTFGLSHQVSADDVLGHRHGALGRAEGREVQLAGFERFGKGEEAPMFHDELRDRVVLSGEFSQGDGFSVLQSLEHAVVAHQLAEVDVVALVNRGKGCGDDDADAGPPFALGGRFTARAGAFALA